MEAPLSLTCGFQGHLSIDIKLAVGDRERQRNISWKGSMAQALKWYMSLGICHISFARIQSHGHYLTVREVSEYENISFHLIFKVTM